jgi:hypothetical protein
MHCDDTIYHDASSREEFTELSRDSCETIPRDTCFGCIRFQAIHGLMMMVYGWEDAEVEAGLYCHK